ncbi:MAG: RsmF rRNA methyltransferase first C-terminal domain-containing protein [Bacteroidaceae bacterium]|nr:RsmF rRNA methyltransferase first C-terminal domain-containing protein [Bacteroidaceae bacterium]
MELNGKFVERTRALFGEERYGRFVQALETEPVVSIRFNGRKMEADSSLNAVPWASAGRYLESRPVFTADPLFHAGCYYVQEASSMFVEQVVRQYLDRPVRALDLCAAPGGKSTLLLSLLPQGSMLVSNEPVPLRAQILAENVTKWGNAASLVTRNEPADFAPFRNFFDFILVDAPCSGEGMFRKDSYAVEQWSVSNVEQCAKRQREIVADIWESLRPGGLLVYSTCTFNREENEDCVEWIASELGAEVLKLEISDEWNITGSLTTEGLPVYRFIPGYTAGEGLFLAVLRKDGSSTVMQPKAPRMQLAPAKLKSEVAKWIAAPGDFDFVMQGDTVIAMPKEHTAAMLALQQKLKVLHMALPLAEVKNNKILPLHALAMSTELVAQAFNTVELERENALAYLHREALLFADAPVGHLLLTYKGTPIGFVKNIGNRANNLYPAEWRIRKNPLEL